MSRRVTLFINSLRGGGAERVCATLANQLRSQGWNIEILVLNLRDASVRNAVHPAVPIVDLNVRHARTSLLAVARYLRERRPEQFLVFNHQLAILLVWLRSLRLGRFSIVARNISTLSRKAAFERSWWHRHVVRAMTIMFYRRVDIIIAQSEGMKHDLIANYGIDACCVRVIFNPLSEQFSRYLRQAPLPWSARREELLYVGRLTAIKGLDLLMASCAICMRRNRNLVLRIVGEGEEKSTLQHQARRDGIAERVVFEGYVADTAGFYAQARVLLLTSQYEGFPNVLLESIAQGTPVVSVDCASGPSEIIQEGVNGFLVKSRNAEEFAAAIERALCNQWDARSIQRTAERYSGEQIAHRYAAELIAARERA